MALDVFQNDPGWAVGEFLLLALDAMAHRIRSGPTILSSRIQDEDAADAYRGILRYGADIGPAEPGDPRMITYLAEEMAADDNEIFTPNQGGMVPNIDRFDDEEAREILGAEDSDLDPEDDYGGWYAQMTMPGYMDQTNWMGPYETEEEAFEALEEEYGPFGPPPLIQNIIDWLRGVWIALYQAPIAGYRNPKGSGVRLRGTMFDFAVNYMEFDQDFASELIESLPYRFPMHTNAFGANQT